MEVNAMDLRTNEQITTIAKRKGLTIKALADKLEQSPQNLNNKLKRNNFTENELREIADALGCDIVIEFVER